MGAHRRRIVGAVVILLAARLSRANMTAAEVKALRLAGRLPIAGAGLDGFAVPEICDRSPAVNRTASNPVPGFFARRVALLVTRQSHRGFSGMPRLALNPLDRGYEWEETACFQQWGWRLDKASYEYTAAAHEMQLAVARALVGRLVKPLERAGVRVDVVLQASEPARPTARTARYMEELFDAFGRDRVVRHRVTKCRSGRVNGQTDAMREALEMLEDHILETGAEYRSVLISRYDNVPGRSLTRTPVAETVEAVGRYEASPTRDVAKRAGLEAEEYLIWASTTWGGYLDAFFALPGWYLGCALGAALHAPDLSPGDWWTDELGPFVPPVTSGVPEALQAAGLRAHFMHTVVNEIYRGPFSMVKTNDGGAFVCRDLRAHFRGPSCSPVWTANELCTVTLKQSPTEPSPKATAHLQHAIWNMTKEDCDEEGVRDDQSLVADSFRHPPPHEDEVISLDDFLRATHQACSAENWRHLRDRKAAHNHGGR